MGDKLYQRIHEEAPKVQLMLLNWSLKTLEQIHSQDINLGINYESDNNYKDVEREKVGIDDYSIYVRRDHPFTGDTISPQQVC